MFDISLLSKYRKELMGFATLLIILCHMPAHGVVMPAPIASFLQYGGLGCDIFLFLSGMGMWYSLKKVDNNRVGGAFPWLLKRYIRILVPYLIFAVPCFGIYAIQDDWTLRAYLWRLSTLSFWTDHWGLWFVSLILVLYLITPLLEKLLDGKNKWILLIILLIIISVAGSYPVLGGIWKNIQFALCRVPCYLIGFTLAEDIKKGLTINLAMIFALLLCVLMFFIALRVLANVSISLFWLEGMILLVVVTLVITTLKEYKWIMATCAFLGSISLESYCTNVFALQFFKYVKWQIGNINLNPGNWAYYIVGTICCLAISVIINRMSKKIVVLTR